MHFLDVKTDYAFKKVFGSLESKPLLISFLNNIIYYESKKQIEDLTIVDPYNIPMIKGMKDTFVDVKAVLNDKTTVIIEMQVLNHKGLEKRILYNAAKNYSTQLNTKEDYHLLNPVIALTIVDFIMFDDSDKIISNFKLIEKEKFINYNDDIELIFVELPKFKTQLQELQNIKEQWIYFLQNAGSLEFIPKEFDSCIQKALDVANEAGLTKEELEAQHKRKEFIFIQKSSVELAEEKGRIEGLEQGLEKGIEQGLEQGIQQGQKKQQIEIAINLLDVLDNETISIKTKLTISEVQTLRNKHTIS